MDKLCLMFIVLHWLFLHGDEAWQTTGIIGGLIFTGLSFQQARNAQRITNLFTLTQYHHELFQQLFQRPELRRVFQRDTNLSKHPVTEDERLFLTLLILHVNLALEAIRMKAIIPIEGLERDLAEFFSKPIPKTVWRELRQVQNQNLVEFIDRLTHT